MLRNRYHFRVVTVIVGALVFALAFVSSNNHIVSYLGYAEVSDASSVPILSLSKLRLSDPAQDNSPFLIHVSVHNNQESARPYLLLVEVRNADSVTISLEIINGMIGPLESKNVTNPWRPEAAGRYDIRLFAISDFGGLEILSPVANEKILTIGQNHCDESLWDHVYHPSRLGIVEECISVTGTVTFSSVQRDGDQHLGVKLDPVFAHLINEENVKHQNGAMLTELICQNPPLSPSAETACENFEYHIDIPPRGTHVRVTGTYVLDKNHHSWAEIHPVTSIIIVEKSG